MFDNDDDKTVDKKKDKLILDYDTILKESALLTTFAGILFGFLLDISINTPETFDFIDRVVLIVALFSVTFAASIFIMPVIYHHLEYPYGDLEKFKSRSHRFIMFGLMPAGITLYLGLVLSLSSLLERFPAFLISSIPFILIYVFFRMRK
jgi:uncharacterized protein DUF6328